MKLIECNNDSQRIAFLTPEFVTEYQDGGGLGNYLNRITRVLHEAGHRPEVFVISKADPGTIDHDGIQVHRVRKVEHGFIYAIARRLICKTRLYPYSSIVENLAGAWALAEALKVEERRSRYSFIQSSDYLLSGFFVPRRSTRPHLIRCSWACDLYADADGKKDQVSRLQNQFEIRMLRSVDRVYSPSVFVADHYRRSYGIDVQVVRPPLIQDSTEYCNPSLEIPPKFFVHFGQLRERKGTDWLARALVSAWDTEPRIEVVMAGHANEDLISSYEKLWGKHSPKVHWVGALKKPELYAVLRRADAAVLPSIVDNLPNTVIESLMHGVPVIGTDGASINELVETGVTGELVASHDIEGLSQALVKAWKGDWKVRRGFDWHRRPIATVMQPRMAVESLLDLVQDCTVENPSEQTLSKV
ncbi:glycosyltransferase family 4 protein [Tautonia marina]|uniref:glycosyltransferase family 4 protein n=1 Tax=Tautonia marina TaxID=2653855 RepID=UPI001375F150|nr:glycosyltransferase family 4 protein [Tautonia marina]